mmetsp:Transcript_84565/g.273913  ORF Transcript_84565/g.273913 Transcript_84565/m.273913 type:complete len:282 (+) Transcript_84565:612-1457(+)
MVHVRAAHGVEVQRVLGVLGLLGVEQPGAAEGARAALAPPAVHGQDVLGVRGRPGQGHVQEVHHLGHERRRVVLDVEELDEPGLKGDARVGELRARVDDQVALRVEGLEEAHHLVQGVAVEAGDGAGRRHAHADEPGRHVDQVEVEVVLLGHEAPLVLAGDAPHGGARAAHQRGRADDAHEPRHARQLQEARPREVEHGRPAGREARGHEHQEHGDDVEDVPELAEEDARAQAPDAEPDVEGVDAADQHGQEVLPAGARLLRGRAVGGVGPEPREQQHHVH